MLLNRLVAGKSRSVIELLRQGTSPEEILERIETENLLDKKEVLVKLKREFNSKRELEMCERKKVWLLHFLDPSYPEILKQIADPPVALYAKGEQSLWRDTDECSLAVVGSRKATLYGMAQTRRFCLELAREGITIVSGMAEGIDHAAHRAALEITYGRTIAVLGSGIDIVYPRANQKIYDMICERGLVFSEFAFGMQPLMHNFPTRNRIISGLSLGVFVVEAHQRSGSLITAHQAAEQGRDVFALPGPVDQLTSRGTHELIKQGAALVENPDDILENLWPILKSKLQPNNHSENQKMRVLNSSEKTANANQAFSAKEKMILDLLSSAPSISLTELITRSEIPSWEVMPLVTRLELLGKIQKNGGAYKLKTSNVIQ